MEITTPVGSFPDCVELGLWTAIPQPPPSSLSLKLDEVNKDASQAIKATGVMTFHAVGCTGCRNDQRVAAKVADTMAAQVDQPHRWGGTTTATSASFLYHLGDLVYKKDKEHEEEQPDALSPVKSEGDRTDFGDFYNTQFYQPYKVYKPPIFAVAGNHDGKDKPDDKPRKSAIHHFLKNFCGQNDGSPSDNRSSDRSPMRQPYPYWLLETPLAYFIGLYTNVNNAGQLDDPTSDDHPQLDWLVQTLRAVKSSANGRAIFLTLHYPPYSAATDFLQRGDPNIGPSAPAGKILEPVGMQLQQAFRVSGQYPDAVMSAHAHMYQRITYTCADGRQIPYLIGGGGGHVPVEKLAKPCAKSEPTVDISKARPEVVLPKRLTVPEGDSVELAAFNDQDFGFLRLTWDDRKHNLIGEYFAAVPSPSSERELPAVDDSFTLDLDSHTIK
jgi:acid phosphatase type 7